MFAETATPMSTPRPRQRKLITMSADDQAMPTDEDIAALHREIRVKAIMVDALKAASPNTPILGLPLSNPAAATLRALLKRS